MYNIFCIYKHIHKNTNNVFICYFSGDIIFNAHYPDLPPDFIFGEDAEFLPDPSALHVSTSLFESPIPCKETWLFKNSFSSRNFPTIQNKEKNSPLFSLL